MVLIKNRWFLTKLFHGGLMTCKFSLSKLSAGAARISSNQITLAFSTSNCVWRNNQLGRSGLEGPCMLMPATKISPLLVRRIVSSGERIVRLARRGSIKGMLSHDKDTSVFLSCRAGRFSTSYISMLDTAKCGLSPCQPTLILPMTIFCLAAVLAKLAILSLY